MGKGYTLLFNTEVIHEFYTKGLCTDFDFLPTAETLSVLKNHRLLFKKKENGFAVYSPVNADGSKALIELDDNVKFSFLVLLKNLAFLNFTHLSQKNGPHDIFRFCSSSNPSVGLLNTSDIEVITVKPKVFKLSLNSNYSSVLIKVYNEFNDYVFQTGYTKTAAQKSSGGFVPQVSMGLQNLNSGVYRFDIYENGLLAESKYYYLSDELKKIKAFGVAEIYNTALNKLDINNPRMFKLSFKAQKKQWHYLVQLKKDYSGSTIVMEDKAENSSLGFMEYGGETNFKEGVVLKFKSVDLQNNNADLEIPYSESPLKKLEIKITKNNVDVCINNIANPTINHIKPEVYINI